MNNPFLSIRKLWPQPTPADLLPLERPADMFAAGDPVWYIPDVERTVFYEAFVEAVDDSDHMALIAYYMPAAGDWVTGWRSIDQLVFDEQFPLNIRTDYV